MGRRHHAENGQEMVEFALVLPLFLLLILGIIEFTVIIFSYNTIANAAREGARSAIIHPYDLVEAEATVRARALALDQTALQVVSAHVDRTVQVTVTYGVNLMTGPFIEAIGGNSTVNLRSVATMYTE